MEIVSHLFVERSHRKPASLVSECIRCGSKYNEQLPRCPKCGSNNFLEKGWATVDSDLLKPATYYTIFLKDTSDEDGGFNCPKCQNRIKPNDNSETNSIVLEQSEDNAPDEYMLIQCLKCNSKTKLILELDKETKEEKNKNLTSETDEDVPITGC